MTTKSSHNSDLQTPNPARRRPPALERRQALKAIGGALAGGLATFFWPRFGSGQRSRGLDVAPQRASRPESRAKAARGPVQAPDAKPNILFILGDNHHYATMGCAGHPFIETPGMDRIAAEGLLFENAFNTTALCSPSRASILTGAYARNHEVKNNHTPWTGQMTTFLEYLSRGGYATAFIGKWHMPGEGLPEMPFLDLFVSYTYREGQGAYFDCPMIVNGQETPSRTPYISEEVTNYALEFMQANLAQAEEERRPFCIYLSHRAGHPPYQAPEGIAGMYDEASLEGVLPDHVDPWWYGKSNRNVFQGVMLGSYYDQYRRYCETLTAMDRDIARLLDFLDEQGLRDNTVVIYMGDNGMQWGTHDIHGIREPYEGSIRLPFMVRAPGLSAQPGARRPQMALNIDLAPTLLDLAALPVPADMDGESLVPILRDPEVEGREHFLLEFWRYFPEQTPSYTGVRTDRYKYIEFARGRRPWLFDLQEDPGEENNLYKTAGTEALVDELKAIMEESG